jgi:hypothetical protein
MLSDVFHENRLTVVDTLILNKDRNVLTDLEIWLTAGVSG